MYYVMTSVEYVTMFRPSIMHQKICPNNVGGYISAETEGQAKGLNSS